MSVRKLSSTITKHLDVIAEKLWMEPSHACVLVGAGFSRNAIKTNRTVKTPPVWSALGDGMLKLLHGKKKINRDYVDVLNVAQEYVAVNGRKAMDAFLEREIPDKGLEPSDLHKMLMSLPWTDVFTTNYDTLLERAADDIVGRNYERVVNKDKLVLSHSPRIIKLHGSFDSNESYVISTEDYRRYPIDQASMVNTMQQSLIENTLCLFGFSGDDPNFLKWIGWIRDNLGKSMPKIYLIGYLKCEKPKRRLLSSRNIVPIDIAPICESTADIPEALKSVIQYLLSKRNDTEDWAYKTILDEQGYLCLPKIKQQYLKYPGWLIIPHSKREHVINYLYSAHNDALLDPNNLELAYYVNWYLEKVGIPLFKNYVDYFEPIIIHNEVPDNEEAFAQWSSLVLAIMRAYRENAHDDKWEEYKNKIEANYKRLNEDLKSRYLYELCLFDISAYDFKQLYEHLQIWKDLSKSALWQAKRAALVAEFFDIAEAQIELESALKSIRALQNLSPISGDYSNLSAESVILFILGRIKQAKKLAEWELPTKEDTYTERTHELANYFCDPLAEIINFEKVVKPYVYEDGVEEKPSFDLDRKNITYNWTQEQKQLRIATQFMRVLEEYGVPLSLCRVGQFNKEFISVFINNLSQVYPTMAAVIMLRSGNIESVDGLFGRKMLMQLTRKTIDDVLRIYIGLFKDITSRSKKDAASKYRTDAIRAVIPEIVSRLVSKASYDERLEVLHLIELYYKSKSVELVPHMEVVVKRLMNSFTIKEQHNLLRRLFYMPFPRNIPMSHTNITAFDPISYINIPYGIKTRLGDEKIDQFIKTVRDGDEYDRKVACWRLYVVYQAGLLNRSQIRQYARNIWSRVNQETGFPADVPFFKETCLKLPHPARVNAHKILRKYLQETSFAQNESGGTAMCKGEFANWNVIINSSYTGYKWSREEILKLTDDILVWWTKNKSRLLKRKSEMSLTHTINEEYECRLIKIIAILSNVVRPNWRYVSPPQKEQLVNISYEALQYTRSALSMQAVLLSKSEIDKNWASAVVETLASNEESEVGAAGLAIQYASYRKCLSTKCADALCQAFAFDKNEGMTSILVAINQALSFGWIPNKEQQEMLAIGLKYQNRITEIQEGDSEIKAESRLHHRVKCVEMASKLRRHRFDKDSKLEEEISQWLAIAENENEFCEIRNAIEEKNGI